MLVVVELEDTQSWSEKNRSTPNMFKQIKELVESNQGLDTVIVIMEVEAGFDQVDVDDLCAMLSYRGATRNLI